MFYKTKYHYKFIITIFHVFYNIIRIIIYVNSSYFMVLVNKSIISYNFFLLAVSSILSLTCLVTDLFPSKLSQRCLVIILISDLASIYNFTILI